MKKHLSTIILVLIFIVGLAVLLYPSVSDLYNSRLHAGIIDDYSKQVSTMTAQDFSEYWEAVDAYNQQLARRSKSLSLINGDPVDELYESLLNVTGTGMMGYIEIPSIDVQLPIYHGSSDAILSAGVGHIEGSSLPGGGSSTHVVLSGHRGLPSSRLFTDLDKLEEGDVFYLYILDRTLVYQVDQIQVVLPSQVDDLTLEDGQDAVTLVTCTPYGVNTHRLLIRGIRVDTDDQETASQFTFHVYKDAELYSVSVIAPIAAVPLLVLVLIYILVHYRSKKTSKMHEVQK
jgi:sortase A